MSRSALFIQGTPKSGYNKTSGKDQSHWTKICVYGGGVALGYTYLLTKHIAFEVLASSFYSVWKSNSYLEKKFNTRMSNGIYFSSGIQAYF